MLHDDPGTLELAIFDAEAWLIMESHGARSELAPVVARLTPLVRAHPDYTGLVHFYIHATEDAGEPQLAESYAPRLAELCPNASHLVHMPSHTYYRVGRYADGRVRQRCGAEGGPRLRASDSLADAAGAVDVSLS